MEASEYFQVFWVELGCVLREAMRPCPQTPDKKWKVMHNFVRFGKLKKTIHYLDWFEYKLTAAGIYAGSKLTFTLLYSIILNSGLSGSLYSVDAWLSITHHYTSSRPHAIWQLIPHDSSGSASSAGEWLLGHVNASKKWCLHRFSTSAEFARGSGV